MDTNVKEICCIGAGYVGGPTMAVIAKYCPEINVTIVDIDRKKISEWNSEKLPIYEPGLYEVVMECRNRNLFFTTEIENSIKKAQIIFVAVNTPTKEKGVGSGCCLDISSFESAALSIAKYAVSDVVVVEKSTVPVKTAEKIKQLLCQNNEHVNFEVLSNPEFLAEGTAIEDLKSPDRILIGSMETKSGRKASRMLSSIYERWVPKDRIVSTGVWSAELGKLSSNAILAQRISSINALSALCEKVNANVHELSTIIGSDSRIGNKFLKSGIGFGGSCFEKDILGLVYLCEYYQLSEVANYWRSILNINNYQKYRFFLKLMERLFGSLRRKKVCILGLSFKKDTGDTRNSPSIDIIQHVLNEGAVVSVYDPKVTEESVKDISEHLIFEKDVYNAASSSNAICVLTDWDEFKYLDFGRIFESMKKPAIIMDGRNVLDHDILEEIGFSTYSIGVPSKKLSSGDYEE